MGPKRIECDYCFLEGENSFFMFAFKDRHKERENADKPRQNDED